MRYLMLSTYPISGSRNSGDDLLGKSFENLLRKVKGTNLEIDYAHITDSPVKEMDLNYSAILSPALRPTVFGDKVSPKYRNDYLSLALNQEIPVIAAGAGWKKYPGTLAQSKKLNLEKSEKTFLSKIFEKQDEGNMISCRDIYTENLLANNGVPCFGTTGDLGLFDPANINKPMNLTKQIKLIAVTMPHNKSHYNKAYKIVKELKERYQFEVKVVFHGYFGSIDSEIVKRLQQIKVEIIDLSGGAEKLNYYDNVDLHIGFRLHAHIWFLRTRKPSLLIAEDGRGSGHLATLEGLGYSASPYLTRAISTFLPKKVNKATFLSQKIEPTDKWKKLLEKEIETNFEQTKKSLLNVDRLWETRMKPFIENIPK